MARLNIDLLPLAAAVAPGDFIAISDQSEGPATRKAPISLLPASGGKIDANGVQTAPFDTENLERTFYTLTIPANTLAAGDLLRVHHFTEVIGAASGVLTTRVRFNGIEQASSAGTPIVGALVGFEFMQLAVIDTGAGMSAARLVNANNSVDFVIDATAAITVAFSSQWAVADVGNEYQGLFAHLSLG